MIPHPARHLRHHRLHTEPVPEAPGAQQALATP